MHSLTRFSRGNQLPQYRVIQYASANGSYVRRTSFYALDEGGTSSLYRGHCGYGLARVNQFTHRVEANGGYATIVDRVGRNIV